MNDIYKSGGVVEDFKVEDGIIYQVRHQDMDKFKRVKKQIEDINASSTYRPEIRGSYSIPEGLFPEIAKKFGKDMHPLRYQQMSLVEKEKFKRIIRTHYPDLVVGGFSKRYF